MKTKRVEIVVEEGISPDIKEKLEAEGLQVVDIASPPRTVGLFPPRSGKTALRVPIVMDSLSGVSVSRAQAEADLAKEAALIPESEIPVPEFDPLLVENRTRAEKIVKILYGPQARVRFYLDQVPEETRAQIVRQEGGRTIILRNAKDLTQLLSEPLESYIKGGPDLQGVEARIAQMAPLATLGVMAYRALMQFPAYVDRRRREEFRRRKFVAAQEEARAKFLKGANLQDLVHEAEETLGSPATP